MRPANILLVALLLACLFQAAEAIEEGVIAVPSMPVPNMDMPSPRVTAPSTGLADQKTNVEKNNSSPEPDEADDPINGKWTIRFESLLDRSLDLTLWSSGKNKIMGFGTLTKGGAEISVTASGSKKDREISLVVKSAQAELGSPNYSQYDLDMLLENSTLRGSYTSSSGDEVSVAGNVTAIKR